MKQVVNILDLLIQGEYTNEDFIKMFQNQLYKQYNIILLEEDLTKWDSEKEYDIDDCVYTNRLGQYLIYVSLLQHNTEPLNNDLAWKNTDNILVDKTELDTLKAMLIDILPANLFGIFALKDDIAGINKLKYIIGLFLSCYLANKNGALDGISGGRFATYQSIDGLTASYQIPDYALDPSNLFYINNPFGLELLSLVNRLLIQEVGQAVENLIIYPNWRYSDKDKDNF